MDHIRHYRSLKLNAEYSTRTVQYQLALLRKALQQAVDDGLLSRNSAQGVKVKQERKEIRPLTSEQAKRLLTAAEGDRLEPLYILAIHTGFRQGELLALKWKDIDLKSGILSVNRTLVGIEDGRPVFGTPKTQKSRRSLKLTKRSLNVLKRHKKEWYEGVRGRKNSDLVFTSKTSTPLNRHNLSRRSFKPLLRKAGLPEDIRFHDLRHTFATILTLKGTNPKIVSEMLGHSDVGITLNVYSHVLPNMQDRAVDDMDDALS